MKPTPALIFFADIIQYAGIVPWWTDTMQEGLSGWLHIISDLLVWIAYFVIPAMIVVYIRRRGRRVNVNGLFFLFFSMLFIGVVSYLVDALIFWQPYSGISAVIRFCTAVISWITVLYVVKTLPVAFPVQAPVELQEEIDRRIRAERELKANNERLLEAERTAKLGHGHWDLIQKRGGFSDMAYFIMGITSGATLSYDILKEQIHPADLRFVEDCLKKNLKARKFQEFYFRVLTMNMEVRHVLVKGDIIRNAMGVPILIKGTIQDVSELRQHMQRIEQQNKKLKKIAWVQSHRMRSPVATIIGLTDLFNQQNPADPVNADIIDHIKTISVQLDTMIREVDELTREKQTGKQVS